MPIQFRPVSALQQNRVASSDPTACKVENI